MKLFKNWNMIRGFRLILGLLAIGVGLYQKEVPLSLLGLFFTYQSIFLPDACCGGGSCYRPSNLSDEKKDLPIEFSEIENKK